jgi:hypothetical protein
MRVTQTLLCLSRVFTVRARIVSRCVLVEVISSNKGMIWVCASDALKLETSHNLRVLAVVSRARCCRYTRCSTPFHLSRSRTLLIPSGIGILRRRRISSIRSNSRTCDTFCVSIRRKREGRDNCNGGLHSPSIIVRSVVSLARLVSCAGRPEATRNRHQSRASRSIGEAKGATQMEIKAAATHPRQSHKPPMMQQIGIVQLSAIDDLFDLYASSSNYASPGCT